MAGNAAARPMPTLLPRRSMRLIVAALIGAILFAILAVLYRAETILVRWDRDAVTAAHQFTASRPRLQAVVTAITDLGAGRPLWLAGAITVAALLFAGDWRRALLWTLGMLASRPVAPWLKAQFERVRPPFVDWADYSFPSGHAFGSAVVYGLAALAILHLERNRPGRWLRAGILWAWVGLVAASRVLLGVHYPSDVLAGAALGLGWGCVWAAVAAAWENHGGPE